MCCVQWLVGGSDSRMADGKTDDLATLSELEENSLLEELQARYNKDIIYVIKPCRITYLTSVW